VVLRAHLYNPPPALQKLYQSLDKQPCSDIAFNVRSPVRRSNRTRPIQKQTKLTEREIQSLTRDYQSGETISALAAKYNIHRCTVYAHIDREQVPRRQGKITRQQVEQAGRLYEQGLSLAKVGEHFNVDAHTIRDRIAKDGVAIRRRRGWPPR
jgi:predicted DNA-binding protein YlxM (UPF0122 family)